MRLLVTGAMGGVGQKVMRAFPGSVGLDIRPGTDITADLATIDYSHHHIASVLDSIDALVHLGTSPEPHAPPHVHWQAVANAARLMQAAERVPVPRVVLASSDWAEPKSDRFTLNAYGHSKRVFEAMAAMYTQATAPAVALRIGWVPHDPKRLIGAEQALLDNYWDDTRLIAEIRSALGLSS